MAWPYIGKSVHYVADTDEGYGTTCRAALVTNVWPTDSSLYPSRGTIVNLSVIDDRSVNQVSNCWFNEGGTDPGTWHEIETIDCADYS